MKASVQPAPKGKIIVTGILFSYPLAGVTWQFLHYLIGLQRLGYDVYYIEDSSRWPYNPWLREVIEDPAHNIANVAPALEQYGFGDRWAFRAGGPGEACYGMTDHRIDALYRDADAMLNVTGSQEILPQHMVIKRRIYVESDPVAAQVSLAHGDTGTLEALAAHDVHFSFGENLGSADCRVPVQKFEWLPTRQPVVLDAWTSPSSAQCEHYTTIMTWSNSGKDIVWDGDTYYWSKDREFRKYLDLPGQRPVRFEMAMSEDPEIESMLRSHGWRLADALHISGEASRYRNFISNSRAEFTVAKDQYVRMRTGWFSDRSASYLAAARPVITQDTAFGKTLPTGRGLFAFQSMEDVLAAVDAIESDYSAHCRAAREIAAEYFDAVKVLASLMARAGF